MLALGMSSVVVITTTVVELEDLKCLAETEIATEWKFRDATFPSDGEMPRIKQLVNEVSVTCQQLCWGKCRTKPVRIRGQNVDGEVACRPFLKVIVWLFVGWASYCGGCNCFILESSVIFSEVECSSGIEEVKDCVHELSRDSVRYMKFVYWLHVNHVNCNFCCCIRERKFSVEVCLRRRRTGCPKKT